MFRLLGSAWRLSHLESPFLSPADIDSFGSIVDSKAEIGRDTDDANGESTAVFPETVLAHQRKVPRQSRTDSNNLLFSQPRLTSTFVISVIAVAVGSAFCHGWNIGVTNPTEQVRRYFNRT